MVVGWLYRTDRLKAHIVALLGQLYNDGSIATKLCCSPYRVIRSFESLDS